MNGYKEVQRGGVISFALLFVLVLTVLAYAFKLGNNPVSIQLLLLASLIIGIVLLLFNKLSTNVSAKAITLRFGIGLIKKQIEISEIERVEVVRNKWYYGWGIRFIFTGWMWNISGFNAIELCFKNKKQVFRIGSANAPELKEAIDQFLSN